MFATDVWPSAFVQSAVKRSDTMWRSSFMLKERPNQFDYIKVQGDWIKVGVTFLGRLHHQ